MRQSHVFQLRPGYVLPRVICGGWQLAGGHGAIDRAAAVEQLLAFAEAGVLAFDCADIYTGVEELLGAMRAEYRRRRGSEALSRIKVHTKCVPNLETLAQTSRASIRAVIDTSIRRLGMERLDLVQFHWWDYSVPGYVDAALWLKELQAEGKIDVLGGTNFDTTRAAELVAAGYPLASLQVQYSLLDNRPAHRLVSFCEEQGVVLLCYGTVAGGFLSDKWLGAREPEPPFENRSLTKYKLIIDDFGGWDLFQDLLRALRRVADRHRTDIASVASRAMLEEKCVGAVILGARSTKHLVRNAALMDISLTAEDLAEIAVVTGKRKGPYGDTFELERDRSGKHGAIMKYNLNKVA